MTETSTTTHRPVIQVLLPGAGRSASYRLTPDALVRFAFDLSEAEFFGNGDNLEIITEGGGRVILLDYLALAQADALPVFEMLDGEQVEGEVYLFAFESDQPVTEQDLETAAGAAATGSGAGEYSDDPGTLFDGLNALGPQGDAYDGHPFPEPDPVNTDLPGEAPIPPVAVDDVNRIVESGWNREEGENGHYDQGRELSNSVTGNLLLNDYDGDNIDYPETSGALTELSVNAIDFPGADFTGSAPGPVAVSGTGTQVNGQYGTLTVFADGAYEYVLDETLADPLRQGEEVLEQFQYTAVDPDGNVSNTATLTITVAGTNDAPDAVDDVSAEVVEQGDEVAGIAIAAGNVLHNDSDIDNTGYEDLDPAYREQVPTDPDGLIELGVTGVYSYGANQYAGTPDGNGDFTIDGAYGTLVINGDGTYEYTLDQAKADPLNIGDDPTEFFGYAMWDGEKYDYAYLSIPVNGSNDAPEADPDVNGFTEAVDHAAPADVFGNVLSNDTDIDNTAAELSVASIAYSGSGTPPARVSEAYAADHVIEGEFGTLYLNNDGSYHYVEDKGATDPLNLGDPALADVFTYEVSDNQAGGALTDTATLTVTIDPANDSPVATADVNGFTEAVDNAGAHAVFGNVLENDGDVDNADLGDPGTPELTVAAIAYSGAGDPPVRVSELYASDHIVEGEYGTLYLNDDGSYVYVEDKNATDPLNADDPNVADVFTYTVSDNQAGGALTDTATLTVTISGANDSPTANVDVNGFTEAVDNAAPGDVSGNVLSNDTDIDNTAAELSVSAIAYSGSGTPPARVSEAYAADHVIEGEYGTLYLNDDGSYHYVEDKGATDSLNTDDPAVADVFTYEVSDNQAGGALADSATLTVTISGANDSPVANVDVNGFTEAVDNATPGDVSGNILSNDTDIDNAAAELSVAAIAYSGSGTPPARVSEAYTADHVIEGEYGTLYLNDDGSYHYVEDKGATDPLNVGDAPVADVFTYEVTDNQAGGALADTATLTVTIDPANDAPVAVHDGSHGIFITNTVETVIDDWSGVSGSVITGPGYTVTAESFDAYGDPIEDVQFTTWGNDQHLGIHTNGTSDDQKVDDLDGSERITFEFDDPQSSFSIEFIAQGNNHVNAWVYPIGGGAPELFTNVGNAVYITPGFEFDTIVFIPDGAFGMESLTTVTGGESSLTGTAEGNVLANDFDVDNVTFDDAAASGDPSLMELSVSAVGSANEPGNASSAGTDLEGDYHTIDGEFGSLKIYETGEWVYTPAGEVDGEGGWQNLDHSVTDVFEYTVSDGLGGTDTASIEVSLNVNTTSATGGTGALAGTDGNDVLFPADGDTVTSGSGSDVIVIDPVHLGGDAGVIDIADFSDNDRLALGNMEGATVEITSNANDVSLVFSDIDGSDDIAVNLVGVAPVNDAVDQTVEITTSADLNQLIQTIIDSGNDGVL
jgi:VCBS repeat-containing protein